jgi:hypothetical protein
MEYNELRIELGALATGMFYNAQEERKKAFNRIRQIVFRKLEGISLTEKQDKKEEKTYEEKYTDKQLVNFIKENKIKLSDEEQQYIDKIMELLEKAMKEEAEFKKLIEFFIEKEEIYQKWLISIKGISTLNTANLLQYFGYCEKAKHCSSLWKYAGLHVVNGKAPKLGMYGKGKEVETGLDYNPKLRMLMYRIGDCFIKCRTPKYRDIYDQEKEKQFKLGNYDEKSNTMLNKDVEGAPQSKGHADNRARRRMVKEFLKDYYNNCLLIRGIEPEPSYSARFHPNEVPA